MDEAQYQTKLIKKLKERFPDCVVIKNDSAYQQGIPDLIVLYRDFWAFLEVKQSRSSTLQPNQRYFVDKLDDMSFAAIIYPENEKEVMVALQEAFTS